MGGAAAVSFAIVRCAASKVSSPRSCLRSEAAGEELAQACGDYTALAKIPFDQETGEIGKHPTDKALNTCLAEERKHIVFLTSLPPELAALNDPPTQQGPKAQSDWLRATVLGCNSSPADQNPFCNESDYPILTFGALDLAEYAADASSSEEECQKAVHLRKSLLEGGYAGGWLQELSSASWTNQAAILSNLRQMRLTMLADGHWHLTYAGSTIMDSNPSASPLRWPGCASWTGCGTPGTDFDLAFRPEGGVYDSNNLNQRARMLWRVQGALWMMGALAGEVPAGLFAGFVPAANLNYPSWGPNDHFPAPTLFGEGRFVQLGPDTWRMQPHPGYGLSDSDIANLGEISALPALGMTGVGAPDWLSDLSSATGQRYLGVPTVNAAYDLKANCAATSHCTASDAGPNVIKADQLGQWLTTRASNLNGLRCGSQGNHLGNYLPGHGDAEKFLRLAKMPAPVVCGTPGSEALKAAQIGFFVTSAVPNACKTNPYWDVDVPMAEVGCWFDPLHVIYPANASKFRPTKCSPAERMRFFLNSYPPRLCNGAAELSQAVALACLVAGNSLGVPTTPPAITAVEDIQKLERWIGELERFSSNAISKLYLQNVPDRVVEDFKSGSVGTGSLKGSHGQLVLQLESSVRSVADGWYQLSGRLGKIRSAIQSARLSLDMAKLQSQVESKQLAIQRWQVHSKIAHAIANSVSSFGPKGAFNPVGGAAQTAAGVADLKIAHQELQALGEIENLKKQLSANGLLQILHNLDDTTNTLYGETYTALSELQKATATTAQLSEALRFGEVSAQYKAAKGKGADFVEIDGETIEFPVNVVLNRQYDVTRRRYDAALKEARYLAYVARIAIEQRIGMRLEYFEDDLGPLTAPAQCFSGGLVLIHSAALW